MLWIKEYLDLVIFGVLGLMSFIFVWLTVERVLTLNKLAYQQYKKKHLLEIDLSKNLTIIATIGSNAPYVGLFGTVLGIMVTFYEIAQSGSIEASSVMLGLALALKATAAGIALAIPAMASYNLLERKTEVILNLWLADNEKT